MGGDRQKGRSHFRAVGQDDGHPVAGAEPLAGQLPADGVDIGAQAGVVEGRAARRGERGG